MGVCLRIQLKPGSLSSARLAGQFSGEITASPFGCIVTRK
jgi:hypothetical protein